MKLAILALTVSASAFAQNTQSVLHFANLSSKSLQEATNILRTVDDLSQCVPDPAGKTITISGSATQIALAEWLALRLDWPSGGAAQLYQMPGAADDAVQVIDASGAQTPAAVQELVNVVRTIADSNKVFAFNATKSIVVRSPNERVRLSSWLVSTLLSPPKAVPAEFAAMKGRSRWPTG